MSEPLRTEPHSGGEGSHPADPTAQIERLLLSGLDLYFTGQYQEAINVWTRVVFLERGHGRARAYIERARTAIAEQQRESDELFHQGRAAYERGDRDQARQLLNAAIDRGGSADDALLLLQELNRFSSASLTSAADAVPAVRDGAPPSAPASGRGWVHLAGAAALISAMALFAAPVVSWFGDAPVASDLAATPAGQLEPLPVVRTGEMALERARQFYTSGHLADALRTLDRIDIGDRVRPQAEQLKGDIQRDLLAMVRRTLPIPSGGAKR